jgi:ClpP class serine protease
MMGMTKTTNKNLMKQNNNLLAMLPAYHGEMMNQIPRAEKLLAGAKPATPKACAESDDDYEKRFYRNYLGIYVNQRKPILVRPDGVAVIHVKGFLSPELTFIESCLEATDYRDIRSDVILAEENPAVHSVVFEMDSPGGACIGCLETAEAIAAMTKPKSASISVVCGSACYFLATACNQIYSLPSAMVGSIGTIYSWSDYSGMYANYGIENHIVTSPGADMKAAGNSYRTPTEVEIESINAMVAEYGDQFVGFVKSRRPQISADVLRGNAVSGRLAVGYGLIDGIASLQETIDELVELNLG